MLKPKFRAWDKTNKEWLYFIIDNLQEISSESDNTIGIGSSIYHFLNEEERIDYKSWSQFTGLKDKNGKEIYEGDILKGKSFDGIVKTWKALDLNYFHHWQETQDLIEENGDVEIIGNIYENPELLKL